MVAVRIHAPDFRLHGTAAPADLITASSLGVFMEARMLLAAWRDLEIKMIVIATPGIERCAASRAVRVTLHVLEDGQRCAARAAKYRWLIPFILWPECCGMIGERGMAVRAGIVKAATFHFDGDDVSWSVIVLATGLGIEIYAMHVRESGNHRVTSVNEKFSRPSAVVRRIRRFRACGPRSESRVSNGARGLKHPVSASG
jgi:hypothetical protein